MGKFSFQFFVVLLSGLLAGSALTGGPAKAGPREAAVAAITASVDDKVEAVLAAALGPVYKEWKRANDVVKKGETGFNTRKGTFDALSPTHYNRARDFNAFMDAQRKQLLETGQLLPFRSTKFDPNPDLSVLALRDAVQEAGVPEIQTKLRPIDLSNPKGQARLAEMVKAVELESTYAREVDKLMGRRTWSKHRFKIEDEAVALEADRKARVKLRDAVEKKLAKRTATDVEGKALLALKDLGASLSEGGQKAALKKWSVPVLTAIGLAGGISAAGAEEAAPLPEGGVDHEEGGKEATVE